VFYLIGCSPSIRETPDVNLFGSNLRSRHMLDKNVSLRARCAPPL
jgi:hypothetical protein